MTYTGRRFYGLYLWHYPVFVVLYNSDLQLGGWRALAVGFAVSFVAAEMSYRFVERPFLRLKERVGPARPRVRLSAVASGAAEPEAAR
jgi:peptidoglycan/LPS O-acetylase OafA/YrhL